MKTKVAFFAVFVLLVSGCKEGDRSGKNIVSVVVYDRGTDSGRINVTDNMWTKWIQDKVRKDLGLEIVFFPVSRFDEEAIQATLMAAGNPPDLMFTYGFKNVTT